MAHATQALALLAMLAPGLAWAAQTPLSEPAVPLLSPDQARMPDPPRLVAVATPDEVQPPRAPVLRLGELHDRHARRELIAWAVLPSVLIAWGLWVLTARRQRRGRRRRTRARLH